MNNVLNSMGAPRHFRVRSQPSLLSSLLGVLVGLGLMAVVSPLAAWYGESQHRAQDFASAQRVTAESAVDGYIAVEGKPDAAGLVNCPATTNKTSCVYVEDAVEKYTRTEKDQCGQLDNNAEVVRNLEDECDSDGTNCKPCYRVAEYSWANQADQTKYQFSPFTVTGYSVKPSKDTTFFETESVTIYDAESSKTAPVVGDMRHVFTYLPTPEHVVVAGVAANKSIATGDDKPFVVSGLSYEATQQKLADQDAAYTWMLRIASLAAMVFGMILLVGPLTYFTNIFKFIPVFGKQLDKGGDAVITFIAGLIGVVLWLVVWGIVLVLKNIWLIVAVLVLISLVVFVAIQMGRKRVVQTPNQQ